MRATLLLALVLAGCDPSEPCAGVRDLATSPGGLVLVQEEHEAGWGHTDCMQCHQIFLIHRADCSTFDDSGSVVDLAEVARRADPRDTRTCVPCHGANGVSAWAELAAEDPQ